MLTRERSEALKSVPRNMHKHRFFFFFFFLKFCCDNFLKKFPHAIYSFFFVFFVFLFCPFVVFFSYICLIFGFFFFFFCLDLVVNHFQKNCRTSVMDCPLYFMDLWIAPE